MIIFLSDLHLADREEATAFDTAPLLETLEDHLEKGKALGVSQPKIVLLGDILEVLKSKQWLDAASRPWHADVVARSKVVSEIVAGALCNHGRFFDCFQQLVNRFGATVQYLPGNHDREIGTDAGREARRLMRAQLPCLEGHDAAHFHDHLIDLEHETFACHGHSWDPINRYHQGSAALGDAVVIECVTRLPAEVAARFDLSPDQLLVLHELDNVRPHHPRALAQWLRKALQTSPYWLPPASRGAFEQALNEALWSCFSGFVEQLLAHPFGLRLVDRALGRLVERFPAKPSLDRLLRWAELVPLQDETTTDRDWALTSLELNDTGESLRWIVAGHTHRAGVSSLPSPRRRKLPIYLNTGTWRRVHQATGKDLRGGFASWQEASVVVVYSKEEQRGRLRAPLSRQASP
jgi:UDP-2,3-diacylglucosamine pyrophosphatase LpxH